MALVKVKAEGHPGRGLRIADIFRCKVVDVSPNTYTLEITGNQDKIRLCWTLLKTIGIKEIARTGVIAIQRSKKE